MRDLQYVLENFFTHKDYLAPAAEIPGTLFTPLHFLFAGVLAVFVIASAVYVGHHKEKIRPVFTGIWAVSVIWEVIIVAWESMAGMNIGLDVQTNLSLYPCSLFMYTMPFIIWGRGIPRQIAYSYLCTLGAFGGIINFVYPVNRLSSYSCLSFVGFHTFFFHSAMVFVWMVILISGAHRYSNVKRLQEVFYPCIPSLLMSIPANIINYSPIDADYMMFRGKMTIFQFIFGDTKEITITLVMYAAYILIPALCYLPSYLRHLRQCHGFRKSERYQDLTA